jgi:hypothetical protein
VSFFVCPSCLKTLQTIPVRTVTDADWERLNSKKLAPITRPAMAESITQVDDSSDSPFFPVRFAFEDALRTNGIRLNGPVVIALDAMVEALAVSGQKPRTSKSNVQTDSTRDSKVGE